MSNKFYQKESKGFIYNSQIEQGDIIEIINASSNLNTQELQDAMTRLNIPINIKDQFGNNLIHLTLLNESKQKNELNRLNFIKFLVNNNVNPDAPNKNNNTPLHLAAKLQFKDIIEYLLKLGVDPNYKDSVGNTPFHYFLNGKLKKFKSKHVYNLVQPSSSRFNDEPLDGEKVKKLEELSKEIEKELQNLSGIKAVETTIKNSFIFNLETKNAIENFNDRDFKDSSKSLTDKLLPYYNKIVTEISQMWFKFLIDDEIVNNFKNKKDIHDDIKLFVKDSVEDIVKRINKLETDFTKIKKFNSEKLAFTFNPDFIDQIVPDGVIVQFNNNNVEYDIFPPNFIKSIEQNFAPNCNSNSSNYINLDSNLFIGGANVVNIKNTINKNDFLEPENTLENNKLIKVEEYNDYRYDNINLSLMYKFAGYFNLTTTNFKLSISQARKTSLIEKIKSRTEDRNLQLSYWVYVLLSEEDYDDLETYIDNQTQLTIPTDATIATALLKLLNGGIFNLIIDKEISNSYEKIIYAISKKYDSMQQKPIYNHIIDTIFIIRKLKFADESKYTNIINKYLPYLHPKEFINTGGDTAEFLGVDDVDNITIEEITNDIVPSKKFIALDYSELKFKKFIEAYILGLTYLTCFPGSEYYPEDAFTEVNFVQNEYALKNVNKNLPEMGFLNTTRDFELNQILPDYLFLINANANNEYIGPSSIDGLTVAFNQLSEKILEKFYNELLVANNFRLIMNNTLVNNEDSEKFYKKFPSIYSSMLTFNQLNKEVLYQSNKLEIKYIDYNNHKFEDLINLIVNNINKINSYFFINYYIFTNSDSINIPEFYYYKFARVNQQEKSLIYSEKNKNSNFVDKAIENTDSSTDDEKFKEQREEGVLSLYTNNLGEYSKLNQFYVKNILEGQEYLDKTIIERGMKLNKKSFIPPSLVNNYSQFYEYMVASLIIDIKENQDLSNQVNELLVIKNDKDNSSDKFIINLVAKVLGDKFKMLVNNVSWEILKRLVNNDEYKEDIEEMKSKYTLDISPIEDFKFVENTNNDIFEGFYRISEKSEPDNDFILIPNDYTNNDLVRSLNTYNIDNNILKVMLDANCKPYMINKDNRGPIYSCLRNYYHKIFEGESEERNKLVYQQFYENGLIYGMQLPKSFMFDEMKNHLKKLVFNESKLSKILNKFAYNQYQEIKLIILNNEAFGNNILRNMELSYSIVGYIMNQYFFRNLFVESKAKDLIEFLNQKENITKDEIGKSPFFNSDIINAIINSNYYNFLKELENDLVNENKMLDEKKKEQISNNKKILKEYGFSSESEITLLKNKIEKNGKKIRMIKNIINNPPAGLKEYHRYNLSGNFIKQLDDFLETNSNRRGPYMLFWEKYLASDINDDYNLLMLKISKELSDDFSNLDINSSKIGDFNYLNNNSFIYEHSAKIAEEYFKSPKYTNENRLLLYIKEILKHMVQNVICLGFEMSIKKVFFEHFNDSDLQNTLTDVDLIFSSIKSLRTDKKDMIKILYEEVANDLLMSISSPIYKDRKEEINTSTQSVYETLSNYVNLLQLGPLKMEMDSELRKNLGYVINYYSEISPKIIYNWFVTIENYLKFVINQSRIVKTFRSLS